jgi:hypothetical protein
MDALAIQSSRLIASEPWKGFGQIFQTLENAARTRSIRFQALEINE